VQNDFFLPALEDLYLDPNVAVTVMSQNVIHQL
jgi:hypothetical protein